MTLKSILTAGLMGCILGLTSLTPLGLSPAGAETLKVMSGATSTPLNVPMNRAVVVESDQPFTEISIANPGIADITTLSDKSVYVLGKVPGRTTMTILGPDGKLISNVEVQVTPDIAEFKERLKQILPGETIEVRTANDGIVLSGVVSSTGKLDRALDLAKRYAGDRVSNLMQVGGTQQVMLKIRFAEMQRSVAKEISSTFSAGVKGRGGFSQSVGFAGNGGSTSTSSSGIGFSVSRGSLEMGVLLEALESKGMVRTLAEPNLTTLSGQQAKFLAGGEYPVPVSNGDNNGVTIQYKPYGVEMAFTPRVVDNNSINLDIAASVSSIDASTTVSDGSFSINAFKKREASTTVEMHDGESFAIAGLLQDDFRNSSSQIPWLGDIPVLGALFRSVNYERNQTELVIIVTPHLVSPTRGGAMAMPTDRVKLPSDSDMFLFGRTGGKAPKSGAAGEVARQDFGSYGYVMQ